MLSSSSSLLGCYVQSRMMKPLSKRKHWIVARILKKTCIYTPPITPISENVPSSTEAPAL
ncbi:hypothetical protein HN51_065647 [Arachis hypogaea]